MVAKKGLGMRTLGQRVVRSGPVVKEYKNDPGYVAKDSIESLPKHLKVGQKNRVRRRIF